MTCVRSGLLKVCWMKEACRAKQGRGPETLQNWATHLSLGVGGRGWMEHVVYTHWKGAPPGGSATWREMCGHPVWWQGG